jgi:transposase InsO family protein
MLNERQTIWDPRQNQSKHNVLRWLHFCDVFQSHLTTHETLKAKENYELICRDLRIIVQSFLTDNGSAFTSKAFTSQLAQFEQVIRFAGTGAHHHNAIAERNIQTIMVIVGRTENTDYG